MKLVWGFVFVAVFAVGFLFGDSYKDCVDPQIPHDMGRVSGYKKGLKDGTTSVKVQGAYDRGVLAGYDKCFKKGGFIKLEDARPYLEEKAMEVER